MKKIICIAIAGFCGALLRYLLKENQIISDFPLNILLINIIGAFLLSLFLSFTLEVRINPYARMAISTGFFGAFTTFSTFCKDFVTLINNQEIWQAILYLVISLIFGLLASYFGTIVSKYALAKRRKKEEN